MNLVKRCRHGLMIYNRKDIWQGKSFETYGEYSEAEVDVFSKIIKAGDVVIEAGSNIGSHTVPIARFVGPTGTVVAMEPERNNYYTLCGNIAINNFRNVLCFQQAAGDEQGFIQVPEIDYEQTVNFGGIELEHDYSKSPSYVVNLVRIDDLGCARCDLIKIDVEGMEEKVLKGSVETIKKFRPCLYVENDRNEKSESLLAFIDSLGYDIYEHRAPFWNPNNFMTYSDNVFGNVISLNLFCNPKEKQSMIKPEDFKMNKVSPKPL